jgi:hypothetical protein
MHRFCANAPVTLLNCVSSRVTLSTAEDALLWSASRIVHVSSSSPTSSAPSLAAAKFNSPKMHKSVLTTNSGKILVCNYIIVKFPVSRSYNGTVSIGIPTIRIVEGQWEREKGH